MAQRNNCLFLYPNLSSSIDCFMVIFYGYIPNKIVAPSTNNFHFTTCKEAMNCSLSGIYPGTRSEADE